ncbi:acyloxyacyl hydrolase [Litorimonas sp. WD9-15]|uniref:acyloxyacyl hydrolase n=1 Tax=Litorimonas sp. WD9-15 TaxID=3418716 RepID=UPI003D018D4E
MKSILFAATLGLSTLFASTAFAQVSEVRLGINIHDIDWTGFGSGADKERSVALNGEIIFEEPEFLKWALSPQPYIGGSLNLEGETSHGGAGLLWRQTFAEKFYFDFSFGLAAHDGTIEAMPSDLVQRVADDPSIAPGLSAAEVAQFQVDIAEFQNRQNTEIDFGSRILFRQQISLGYRWNDDWSAHIFAEHLSNGKILVQNRPNEGVDTVGFRLARHF